ncbi:MAG: carbohydrate ABC transporter permease [Candidatus Bipolaricaulota bacterium]
MKTNESRKWLHKFRRGLLYLFLSVVAIIAIFPFVLMILTSLKQGGAALTQLSNLVPTKPTLQNFVDVWVTDSFGIYFRNTAIVTGAVILGNIVLDSMVAYALSRHNFFGKRAMFLFIIARMMIPIQVLIIPLYELMHWLKLYDTLIALILPTLVQGFGIFLLKQYFDGIPRSLDEAAIMDGANDFQILWRIMMPLAKPAIAVLVINTALTSWNAFLLPLILTSSEGTRTLSLGLALYSSRFGVDFIHQMAASSISALPILAIFLVFQRQIISGLTKGAIKS